MAGSDGATAALFSLGQATAPDPDEQDISDALAAMPTADADAKDQHADNCPKCPPAKAAQICRQVDFYFSAKNLEVDHFLHKRIKGSKNRPMLLKDIASFKRMQPFHPIEHIFAALKNGSAEVNVFVSTSAELMIQRKEVFHKKPAKASVTGPAKAKAKAASGFEEFFADAPTTPQAADEERALYDPENSIAERMEHAVKRYQTRRKMDSWTRNAFLKWMAFGGMYLGSVDFGGGPGAEELANMTAKQKKEANTTTYAYGGESDDYGNPLWRVGFTDVARAFLSRHMLDVLEVQTKEDIDKMTNIMLNFFRYIEQHDVCPEYHSDVESAKHVCRLAQTEMPPVLELGRRLPGNFNMAASTYYGGQWAGLYGTRDIAEAAGFGRDSYGISPTDADRYLAIATGSLFPDDKGDPLSKLVTARKSKVVEVWKNIVVQVIDLHIPDAEQQAFFYNHLKRVGSAEMERKARPIGMLHCTAWHLPDVAEWDLPPGVSQHSVGKFQIIDLLLDEDLVRICYQGVKIRATVHKLANKMCFFDEVVEVLPSFELDICNGLVLGHKEVHYYTADELREMDGKAVEKGEEGDSEEVDSD